MTFRERLNRTEEAGIRALAHRLPLRLAYWSFIDTGVRNIRPDEIVSEVAFMDLLQRACKGRKK